MEYVILAAIVGVIVVASVASKRRTTAKGRRFGGALSGSFGVLDEVFRPAAYEASTIQEVETRLPAPAPLAGDPGPDGDGD